MKQAPIGSRTLKVRLHQVARDGQEHKLLGRLGFQELIQLLREYPDCGVPILYPPQPARVRSFEFKGLEVITQRTGADELYILTIRTPE
jgi:hypothetical protein